MNQKPKTRYKDKHKTGVMTQDTGQCYPLPLTLLWRTVSRSKSLKALAEKSKHFAPRAGNTDKSSVTTHMGLSTGCLFTRDLSHTSAAVDLQMCVVICVMLFHIYNLITHTQTEIQTQLSTHICKYFTPIIKSQSHGPSGVHHGTLFQKSLVWQSMVRDKLFLELV